jgi:hypothetical protein
MKKLLTLTIGILLSASVFSQGYIVTEEVIIQNGDTLTATPGEFNLNITNIDVRTFPKKKKMRLKFINSHDNTVHIAKFNVVGVHYKDGKDKDSPTFILENSYFGRVEFDDAPIGEDMKIHFNFKKEKYSKVFTINI